MSITLLFDKSAFHSFSYEEVLQLHKYYWVNISPVLVMEVLGDLKKGVADQVLNTQKVIEFANKLYPFNSAVNTHYLELLEGDLLGNRAPMQYKPVVNTAVPVQLPNGMTGHQIYPSEEEKAIERWKEGDFREVDEILSNSWRGSTTEKNLLVSIKEQYVKNYPFLESLKSKEMILKAFDLQFTEAAAHETALRNIIEEFSLSPDSASQIFYRWESTQEKDIRTFAPFAVYCWRVRFLFYVLLRNGVITTRPTNWLDLEYCYYLPFTRVFLSNDKLHDQLVPHLITANQRYIKGHLMKEDLKKIKNLKATLSPEDLRRADREPPRDEGLLNYQIWHTIYENWPPEKDWAASKSEIEMIHQMINQLRNAKPLE
jgi:hypothetical protein